MVGVEKSGCPRDRSFEVCSSRSQGSDPRDRVDRGRLWPCARISVADCVARRIRADHGTVHDELACLEPVAIGSRSHPLGGACADAVGDRHAFTEADRPSLAPPHPATDASSHSTANAPADGEADPAAAGAERADPPRPPDVE